MIGKQLQIEHMPAISAIYFGLLQTGYDFYGYERPKAMVQHLSAFQSKQRRYSFFQAVKQTSCQVYPYWPRAAILETASFYVDLTGFQFQNFSKCKEIIMSANNLREEERNDALWTWISAFPAALNQVFLDSAFQTYFQWECGWIDEQNRLYAEELHTLQKHLQKCAVRYASPITEVHIVLNPIKCVYSSDYHIQGSRLVFSSGAFDSESVIHEFLHPVVHNFLLSRCGEILRYDLRNLGLDPSYYLANDDAGHLNAFEEYFVRALTAQVAAGALPEDLSVFLDQILAT